VRGLVTKKTTSLNAPRRGSNRERSRAISSEISIGASIISPAANRSSRECISTFHLGRRYLSAGYISSRRFGRMKRSLDALVELSAAARKNASGGASARERRQFRIAGARPDSCVTDRSEMLLATVCSPARRGRGENSEGEAVSTPAESFSRFRAARL